MKRFLSIYGYIEWIVALSIIYMMIHIWSTDFHILVKAFIFLFGIGILCFIKFVIHDDTIAFESTKLWKYNCKFYIDSFSINNKIYYIPVINVLTNWGYFYEYIIRKNGELNPKKKPNKIKKIINNDVSQLNRFLDNYIFKSEEDALYAITQIQTKINKVRQTKNQINNNKRTQINFNSKV